MCLVVQSLSCVQLFVTPWTEARQAYLSSTNSWSLLKFMIIESVMTSNHLILCRPLLCPQSHLESESFPMSWLLTSSGQSIGASAMLNGSSILPIKIQDWFLLGLTSLISLLSMGLSRVFSSTLIEKHQFFSTQPSL